MQDSATILRITRRASAVAIFCAVPGILPAGACAYKRIQNFDRSVRAVTQPPDWRLPALAVISGRMRYVSLVCELIIAFIGQSMTPPSQAVQELRETVGS